MRCCDRKTHLQGHRTPAFDPTRNQNVLSCHSVRKGCETVCKARLGGVQKVIGWSYSIFCVFLSCHWQITLELHEPKYWVSFSTDHQNTMMIIYINPAYGGHWISCCVQIEAPDKNLQKGQPIFSLHHLCDAQKWWSADQQLLSVVKFLLLAVYWMTKLFVG